MPSAFAMVIYLVLFAAFAAAVGWCIAIIYERHQDVLYGPYLPRDIRKNARRSKPSC
jgi:hypothetical protein